jgi:hypothetical protein
MKSGPQIGTFVQVPDEVNGSRTVVGYNGIYYSVSTMYSISSHRWRGYGSDLGGDHDYTTYV